MPSATIADHDIEVVATGGLMSAAPSLKLGKHCNFPVIRCGMVAIVALGIVLHRSSHRPARIHAISFRKSRNFTN